MRSREEQCLILKGPLCTVPEKITKLLYEPNHNFPFGTSAVILRSLLSTVSRYLGLEEDSNSYMFILNWLFGKTMQEREKHDLHRDLGMDLGNNSWTFAVF